MGIFKALFGAETLDEASPDLSPDGSRGEKKARQGAGAETLDEGSEDSSVETRGRKTKYTTEEQRFMDRAHCRASNKRISQERKAARKSKG